MSPSGTLTHTYGPMCALYKPTHETSSLTTPAARAQFFYISGSSIDDPISPIPQVSGFANTSKQPWPHPFSARDNAALEEAWLNLNRDELKKEHNHHHQSRDKVIRISEPNDTASDTVYHDKHGWRRHSKDMISDIPSAEGTKEGTQGQKSKSSKKASWKPARGHIPGDSELNSPPTREQEYSDSTGSSLRRRLTSRFKAKDGSKSSEVQVKYSESGSLALKVQVSEATQYGTSPSETDTTGTPFVRAPSRLDRPRSAITNDLSGMNEADALVDEGDDFVEQTSTEQTTPSRPSSRNDSHPGVRGSKSKSRSGSCSRHRYSSRSHKHKDQEATVPVGVFCLHQVCLSAMQMKPTYWSPVHDIAPVQRGTWFYKDSYCPVEPEASHRLEVGYLELRPWTETWNDELNCAVDVGAEGEAKIIYQLYPEGSPKLTDPGGARSPSCEETTEAGGTCSDERCVERLDSSQAAGSDKHANASQPRANANYSNAGVIYSNSVDAYILPSLSCAHRPLASIRKGKTVGTWVVRGFDWQAWEKLHPPKKSTTAIRAQEGYKASEPSTEDVNSGGKCETCSKWEEKPRVTDLVLVIHGIGQKLSERVESFHFTHAINSFRGLVNAEMRSEYVKQHLRPDAGGIMVLPVNWRSTLSFEDGGPPPVCEDGEPDPAFNYFNLSDITPSTIPAMRNLISDVMFDIPYYFSHHKPQIIKAVISEANRIYRLWCKNNPDFNKAGRVHLVAHSLGSAMALDILSKQPTKLPKEPHISKKTMCERFLFDTKCLFLVGSPAGFFLLLNRKSLLPRKGRNKVDMDGEDVGKDIAGDVGTYGCLAIDNLYNVMHLSDPIAYRLNAAVDSEYASSIKTPLIPSTSTTFLESVVNAIKSINPMASTIGGGQQPKPSVERLPSVVEMETHNFTREEIAEKRMYLMNDNKQLDWCLSSGTGPLEIQYLNMLGAHSSYWYSRDFARFLCLEVGRKEGKTNTLVNMRPVKNSGRK
ncbi:hypothetical protein FGG08_003551 [Glutinoglossum americanum]|uniref:DDHD domain-containing protein n=1 Tax=Glutinoglossum americanum TaxID=1670608 RepID=A0A9P8L0H7_9PEZI|nr:hypothetical protein FGG08_003551 [Glutinoglossum americanum]